MPRMIGELLLSKWMDLIEVKHVGPKNIELKTADKVRMWMSRVKEISSNSVIGYILGTMDKDGNPVTPWKFCPKVDGIVESDSTLFIDQLDTTEFFDIDTLLRDMASKRYLKAEKMITTNEIKAITSPATQGKRHAFAVKDLQWCGDKDLNDPDSNIYIWGIIGVRKDNKTTSERAIIDLNYNMVVVNGSTKDIDNPNEVIDAAKSLISSALGEQI
jgi:hypothetical protein